MAMILIADDEPHLLEILQAFLERVGYEVVTASDGCQAWELIGAHQPSLLILDDMMPCMSGSEICTRVKNDSDLSKTPVIIHSANANFSDHTYLRKIGADALLAKPSFSQEIIDTVARWLPQ